MPNFNKNPQVQKMMRAYQESQKKLSEFQQKEFEVNYKNGSVVISIKGDYTITSLKINPALIDPQDPITLQEMVAEAVNEAYSQVKQLENEIANEAMPQGFGGLGGLF